MHLAFQEAAEKSLEYFEKLFGNQDFKDVYIEEIEPDDQQKSWVVTVGFSQMLPEIDKETSPPERRLFGGYPGPRFNRKFKVFIIDGQTGSLRSMKAPAL